MFKILTQIKLCLLIFFSDMFKRKTATKTCNKRHGHLHVKSKKLMVFKWFVSLSDLDQRKCKLCLVHLVIISFIFSYCCGFPLLYIFKFYKFAILFCVFLEFIVLLLCFSFVFFCSMYCLMYTLLISFFLFLIILCIKSLKNQSVIVHLQQVNINHSWIPSSSVLFK